MTKRESGLVPNSGDYIARGLAAAMVARVTQQSVETTVGRCLPDSSKHRENAIAVLSRCLSSSQFQNSATADELLALQVIGVRSKGIGLDTDEGLLVLTLSELQLFELIHTVNVWGKIVNLWGLLSWMSALSNHDELIVLVAAYLNERAKAVKCNPDRAMVELVAAIASVSFASRQVRDVAKSLEDIIMAARLPSNVATSAVFGLHQVDYESLPLERAKIELLDLTNRLGEVASILKRGSAPEP